ncbi:MAG: hypothetical protein ACFFFO_15370 [Candidatus Thorarchaeota archaeon]
MEVLRQTFALSHNYESESMASSISRNYSGVSSDVLFRETVQLTENDHDDKRPQIDNGVVTWYASGRGQKKQVGAARIKALHHKESKGTRFLSKDGILCTFLQSSLLLRALFPYFS